MYQQRDADMRTIILLAVGVVVAYVFYRCAPAGRRRLAAACFTALWLALCAWNLYTGLAHGYSLAEEVPIHLVLFGVPTALAWGLAWKAGRPAP